MAHRDVRLLVFPAEDGDLRDAVEAVIDRLPDDLPDDQARLTAERDLRQSYRSLEIRERNALGGYAQDIDSVWYVFRDGRIRATPV